MQSRLAVSKLNRVFFPTPKYQTIPPSLFSSVSGDADPDPDAMTQGVDPDGETRDTNPNDDHVTSTKGDDHYKHPKTVPPNLSSSKLQTPGVNTPFDPHLQQKRTISSKEELSCAGLDGSPWPDREEEEDDDEEEEYFEHHKASPLSEIEIGDSRKPLAKVAHGTADGYFGDEQVMSWRSEQLDTAESSLRRAREMFRDAATRGVPEWPHSKRLRELRGEDW